MATPSTDRRYGVSGNLGIKAPVKAATTAAITLSGEQTVDGIALVADDRVLVKDQASSIDNGIWVVSTGSWTRDVDFNGTRDVTQGTGVYTIGGTVNAKIFYAVATAGEIVPGTTAITFEAAGYDSSLRADLAASDGVDLVGNALPSVTADFTLAETTDAAINGANPMFTLFANATSALKAYFAEVTGGTRFYLWPAATAVPDVPHTAIPPTMAIHGDILAGDIVALESNPMTYFIRANAGLAETSTTQLFSARAINNDTDGGAGIVYAPALNGGGAVNDGYVNLIAYGLGTGSLANCVILTNRSGSGTTANRWLLDGQSASKGDFVPFVNNTYSLGSSGAVVKELYLGMGAAATGGRPSRVIANESASGSGSPADTVENDLKTTTIPASALNTNGDTLRFRAAFRCAANATTKRIRLYFGATAIVDSTAIAHNGKHIVVEGTVTRVGATSQVGYTVAQETSNNPAWSTSVTGGVSFTSPAETLSGAVVLKSTVQLGAGAALNDVIQDYFEVEFIPA